MSLIGMCSATEIVYSPIGRVHILRIGTSRQTAGFPMSKIRLRCYNNRTIEYGIMRSSYQKAYSNCCVTYVSETFDFPRLGK